MRSVVVVFPASMWAMMPMLRYRSSGVSRAIIGSHSTKKRGDRSGVPPVVSLRARPGLGPATRTPQESHALSLEDQRWRRSPGHVIRFLFYRLLPPFTAFY